MLIDPMLIDYGTLALPEDIPVRRRVTRSRVVEVTPPVPLWDDGDLARLLRDEADALERDSVIRSLADYGQLLSEIGVVPMERVPLLPDGAEVLVAGRRMSRVRDGAIVRLALSDGTGTGEVLFDAKGQALAGSLLNGEVLLIAGTLDERSVIASRAWDLRGLLREWDLHGARQSGFSGVWL